MDMFDHILSSRIFMYQYVWFNKDNYKIHTDNIKENTLNFVKSDDIEYVKISYWGEHCLECAAPQCYNNCEHWVERYDQRCQKFYYGIYKNKDFKDYPFASEIKFRKWGKLETHIYPGVSSLERAFLFDDLNKVLSEFTLIFSKLLKSKIPNCKLNRGVEFLKSKFAKTYRKNTKIKTDVFLFQAYSYEKEEYSLLFDIFTEDKVVYFRENLVIKPGFNQYVIDLENHIDINDFKGLVRIYPENDYEANIVILFSEFVKLKDKSKFVKNNISKTPANKVKCVVWDLDNTIWDNILIETNPNELKLRDNVFETIKALDEKGIIQVIASKNDESDAIPVLKRLKIYDYFVYKMINWNSKSSNIMQIADLLNINVDTFAFIDDSIYERNEVKSNIPCIRIYNENEISTLTTLDEFNVEVTSDSKNRRQMYMTEIKRKNLKINHTGSNIEFLKHCEIEITIQNPSDDETIKRCFELVQRTNQLNLSGVKYSKDEFLTKINNELENSFVVYCKDKFGVYGQVGYFVVETFNNNLYITEFAMSCRVAGKYIESAIINWLFNKFNYCDNIVFKGINNSKNKLLIDTLIKIQMTNVSKDNNELVLTIPRDKKPLNYDIVKVKK